jgi:hypothetical protein
MPITDVTTYLVKLKQQNPQGFKQYNAAAAAEGALPDHHGLHPATDAALLKGTYGKVK